MVVGVVLLDLEGCEIGFNVSVVEAHSTKMIWYQWFLLILAPRKKSLLTLSKRQSFWVRCLVSRELHESPFRLWATKGLSVWMAHPYSFGFNLGCKSSAFDFDGWVSWRIFSKACLKGGNLEAFLTIQSSWTADGVEDDAAGDGQFNHCMLRPSRELAYPPENGILSRWCSFSQGGIY